MSFIIILYLGYAAYSKKENDMKEYKTLKVKPFEETETIQYYESFGWKLDETREVYNENQEVVGEKVTSYNSFMRGFTGNDGKVEVQTRTNVTHFLTMRFSRDTNILNYDKISALQQEFENTEFEPHYENPDSPVMLTIIAVFGFATIILPVWAIKSWISYPKKKKEVAKMNALAEEKNKQIKERLEWIMTESRRLVEEGNTAGAR